MLTEETWQKKSARQRKMPLRICIIIMAMIGEKFPETLETEKMMLVTFTREEIWTAAAAE